MDYNKGLIQKAFKEFWAHNKNLVKYSLRGSEVSPTYVSSFSIQLTEGDFGDGYNFKCEALGLKLFIDNIEKLYDAEFIIKVSYKITADSPKPIEYVESIRDNAISLKER